MRQLYDLTPQQLADRLYMDYNAYVAFENGVFDFTVDQLVYLAELYETSIDYLLGLTDSSAPHYRWYRITRRQNLFGFCRLFLYKVMQAP